MRSPCPSTSPQRHGSRGPLPPIGASYLALSLAFCAALGAQVTLFTDGFESGNTYLWSLTFPDPCPRSCGAQELCDLAHLGFDDDCNGIADEGCACVPGTAQGCFLGDPAMLAQAGCFRGVEHCTENALWGACLGGAQATQSCFSVDINQCHAVSGPAFSTADLASGLGHFGDDALSETWAVTCPDPHATCASAATDPMFHPVVTGEHAVLYTKVTANGSDQCTYPLFTGGPGALRVELQWEHGLGGNGVDLDLHLHRPGTTEPWGGSGGNAVDCTWDNCTAAGVGAATIPNWFTGVVPPAPVDWYLDPVPARNSCYFAPKANGAAWQAFGLGCHNPRLDVDQSSCDPVSTDPAAGDFCAGEVASIDFMPLGLWTRLAVHYYSAHGLTYSVHPAVKIYCGGELAAELGPGGYYVPEAAVAFTAASAPTRYWLVADVAFGIDAYGTRRCLVAPLYLDAASRTPLFTTASQAASSFGPPYPPPPDFGPPTCPQ